MPESIRPGEPRPDTPARRDAWILTSKSKVDSKDLRRHLDWLLDQLVARRQELSELHDRGARIDIFCYWLSATGHGGPTISTTQTRKLAELEIDLSFDLYFASSPRSSA